MENNSFKTTAFGGFEKQSVIEYIERTAKESAEAQQKLREKNAALEKQMEEVKAEFAASVAKAEASQARFEALRKELEREYAARREMEVNPLKAELEQLRAENEALRPDAEAYARFRSNLGAIECDARKRAADLEAATVAQLRAAVDLFRKQYVELMSSFESTASHVTGELRKVEVNLTQLPRAMDQSGVKLNELAAVLEKYQNDVK